jgi:uncharacterized protein
MVLEGTVTNVAPFGAFVDLGVHQDGLVHVSQMSRTFVRDAREAVKAAQVVKVRVLEVDPARKRIALTMRLDEEVPRRGGAQPGGLRHQPPERGQRAPRRDEARAAAGAMAAAFAKLRSGR